MPLTEESNVIPIIKLSNNNGPYYPLSVPEAVYTTHSYNVHHDIGMYKKGDVVEPLDTLDEILTKILGSNGDLRNVNFVGISHTYPGENDCYPEFLLLDDGSTYSRENYTEGDVVIYNSNDGSNVLCVFYKGANDVHGKWLVISDDILYVGNTPPPENSQAKVLWLDTTDNGVSAKTDSPELESIKNLIYKLMASYDKVVKLVENGIKPSDATGIIAPGTQSNNWRQELIDSADPLQPDDVIPNTNLESISIYGNNYTGNGTSYRALFTPNGFTDKRVKWQFGNGEKIIDIVNQENGAIIAKAEIISEELPVEGKETLEKPECRIELYCIDEEGNKSPIVYNNIKDSIIELQAIYDACEYSGDDNKKIGTLALRVGGEKPETDVEPTVKSVCIKMDTAENFAKYKENLIDGEILFYTDKAKFVVYRNYKNDKDVYIQKFYTLQTNESESQGLTENQLYDLALNHLQFKDSNDTIYKVYVDSSGSWKLKSQNPQYPINGSDSKYAYGGTNSRYVSFGVIYCGGENTGIAKCSHSFVEIFNSGDSDYNLGGAYLLYTDCSHNSTSDVGYYWKILRLDGVVKAGSTYTIRGARCNRDDASFIKVDSFDQEWVDTDGSLVSFDTNKGIFYLVNGVTVGTERKLPSALLDSINDYTFKWFNNTVTREANGYIDGFGFYSNPTDISVVAAEGNPLCLSKSNDNLVTSERCIFTKNFILDPSKQALKVLDSKKTNTLWTYIDIDRQTQKLGNSIQYYWPDSYKRSYTPGCSDDNHDFYNYGRSKFNEKTPNIVNITFGKQATATVTYTQKVSNNDTVYYKINNNVDVKTKAVSDNAAFNDQYELVSVATDATYTTYPIYSEYNVNSDASRCFNWISVGNFDEYVEYRIKGSNSWIRQYSIIEKDASDPDSMKNGADAPFIEFYKRFTWAAGYNNVWVTTHKRIIRGLTSGIYEYRIGRDGDNSYTTDIKEFEVKNDAQVSKFRFTQVSDQQGFNWAEYQAWKRSCYMIDKSRKEDIKDLLENVVEKATDIDFTINTGDIAQSGNRISEFIDYFDGRTPLDGITEMFTIGNNDLCGLIPTKFGSGDDFSSKFNPINVRKYYTFELDENNVDDNNKPNCILPSINLRNKAGESQVYNNIPIDSIYSFNYGDYHFVSLNSEYTKASQSVYNKINYTATDKIDDGFINNVNGRIESWFTKDLLLWKNNYTPTAHIKYMSGTKYYKNIDGVIQLFNDYTVDTEIPADGTILVNEPRNCSKCLVYMHEIPFTIVTDNFVTSTIERGGSKLNTNNSMGTYRFSRLFKLYGIRMVFGGHKHTYSMSYPVYDCSFNYNYDKYNDIILTDYKDDMVGREVSVADSRRPVVQFIVKDVTNLSGADDIIKTKDNNVLAFHLTQQCSYNSSLYDIGYYVYMNNTYHKLEKYNIDNDENNSIYLLKLDADGTENKIVARCQLVDTINAPVYIMSQATGFKLVSNKELMTHNKNVIPWIMLSCPEVSSGNAGRNQLDPMYITYDLDSVKNTATVKLKRVMNITTVTQNGNNYSTTCTLNDQNVDLNNSILFEQTLENI